MNSFTRLAVLCAVLAGLAAAQMVNPAIDAAGQPFSYPSWPTDVLGIRDATMATEVTPEGYLYTGFGELMFLAGYPAAPLSQRLRTLENGYLPILNYAYHDGVVTYRMTVFTGALDGDSGGRFPVNFIRVVARNTGAAVRTSYFNVAFRYTGPVTTAGGAGDHRFSRPATPGYKGDYSQPGVEFDPHWQYMFDGDAAIRSGDLAYMFPQQPRPVFWLTAADLYTNPARPKVLPDTPVLMTQYALRLAPGGSQTLVFKMPVQPLASNDRARINELRSAAFDQTLQATVAWWERELTRGIRIALGEPKVTDTFKANLAYDMIARDRQDDDYIQTVNKLQYHAFWLRDGAYIVHAYDVAGYHDLARQCLDFFSRFQKPDGNFVSQEGQYDGWGQTMWAFGQHYRVTRDRDFAERVWPMVQKAVAWLHEARLNDPLHLLPRTNPGDAEFVMTAAHISGHNLWALAGLKNAIELAKAVGTSADVERFLQEYEDYSTTLWKKLDQLTASTQGYIPPGIDEPNGQDWGNMLTLYPEQLLPHFDPKVTGTLEATRAKYREGLMTYAGRLHHYLTMKNTETLIVRGQQREALEELYAVLLHTSATHAGFEWGIRPWGDRDFGSNLTPHGWFGAKYIAVLRNMLLREEAADLHLLSVVSPEWAKPGRSIDVSHAPSYFGPLGFTARYSDKGMTLSIDPAFVVPPANIIVHLPFFVSATSARVDGQSATLHEGRLKLPPTARRVEVSWTRDADVPGLSYVEFVAAYKKEYRARYDKFLIEGAPVPEPIVYY